MSKLKAKKPTTQNIINRRARFDYELGEEIVAGYRSQKTGNDNCPDQIVDQWKIH